MNKARSHIHPNTEGVKRITGTQKSKQYIVKQNTQIYTRDAWEQDAENIGGPNEHSPVSPGLEGRGQCLSAPSTPSPVRGGGTHPDFRYPLQNRPRELWLSTWSMLEKGGAVTDPRTLRRGAYEGAYSVGAVVFGMSG